MSRRGNGEGSIYQMADGRWRAAVSLGWKEGKLRRKVITARTRSEVAEQLKKALRDQQRGLNLDPDKETAGEFLLTWLENTAKPSIRPKTYRSYEQMVRNHLVKPMTEEERIKAKLDNVPGLGTVRLSKLTLRVVQHWLNEKLKAGNSARLVAYLRTILRTALTQAVNEDLLPMNPAAATKPPRVEVREVVPFAPDQAGRFLKAAMGHRLEALFTCALAVGVRSGEASALKWESDVDLDHGTITVRYSLQRQKGRGLVLVPPKSDKGRRTIELPDVCVDALRRHRERQELEQRLAGDRWIETGHVFTSTIGTPIDDRKILKEFDSIVKAAGLPKQRFHDLRHAAITLLGAQGVPVKVIADIVGHSDIRLTQNVYQHVFQPAKRDAANRMNSFLREITTENGVATKIATNRREDQIN
jgi:integrase